MTIKSGRRAFVNSGSHFLFDHSCHLRLFVMTPDSKGCNKVTFVVQESLQTTNIHVKWRLEQMAISATDKLFLLLETRILFSMVFASISYPQNSKFLF